MTVRYRFREWAAREIGSTRPAEVERWFCARGYRLSAETWRKFLSTAHPACIRLDTWVEICEASGEPLSRFIDYIPSGRPRPAMQPARRPKRTRETRPAPPGRRMPLPASDFYRGDHA